MITLLLDNVVLFMQALCALGLMWAAWLLLWAMAGDDCRKGSLGSLKKPTASRAPDGMTPRVRRMTFVCDLLYIGAMRDALDRWQNGQVVQGESASVCSRTPATQSQKTAFFSP